MPLPRIAITCGDPAGVGPELCLKLLRDEAVRRICVPIIFGDASVLAQVAKALDLELPDVTTDANTVREYDKPTILDFQTLSSDDVKPGEVTAATGRASFDYVDEAIRWALNNDVAAIVTGPLHKEALQAAGVPYPGHTELLADRTDANRHCMMLTSDEITCSLVTAHVGLDEVAKLLTTEAILDAIQLSHIAMKRMRGRDDVRLTVCGLNPHAGEAGLFGNCEEERFIIPAINAAIEQGINVVGPLPPDTAFLPAHRGQTDCYICMYHDQGLIPLKALAFDKAVNVTLGLPIVRTSVDHGTALDIAWQGKASVSSFVEAVILAVRLIS